MKKLTLKNNTLYTVLFSLYVADPATSLAWEQLVYSPMEKIYITEVVLSS